MTVINRSTTFVFSLFCLSCVFLTFAQAVEIKTVESQSGIKALLVEDYTLPIISLAYSFQGGSSQDPEGKAGTVRLMTAMMDEGAGEYDSSAFRAKLEEFGVELGFSSSTDFVVGSLRTIRSDRKTAFNLLKLALTEPRFDEEPMERMRDAIRKGIEAALKSPRSALAKAMRETLFAGHPYSRSSIGDQTSIDAITRQDIVQMQRNLFSRDTLVVGVVGAISETELKVALDEIFGKLPREAQLNPVESIEPTLGETVFIDMPVPNSSISLVYKGLKRDDPDFFAAHLLNHILGGGSFSSRLYTELREKRGLVYSVSSGIASLENTAYFSAGTSTRVDNQDEAIRLIKEEIGKLAQTGVTQAELDAAKKYIMGAYAISNLDTSGKIARVLVAIQNQNLGIDYINRRKQIIDRVTLADVNRMARELLAIEPTQIVVGPAIQ